MQGPSNRSVVIISGLLTLLVLGGATLAVAFRNGWVRVASAAPVADADQGEIAVYRRKAEEAYRALDDAYAQVRSLQTAQSQVASRGEGDRAFTDHDDERHERRSRHRESDDD